MPIIDYAIYMGVGFEGQIPANVGGSRIVGSYNEYVNKGTSLLPFGRVVVNKPSGQVGEVQLPSAAGQTVVGVSVASNTVEKDRQSAPGYSVDREVSVIHRGYIFMIAEEDMAVTDPIFFRHTAAVSPGLYDAIGRIRNDANGGTCDAFTAAKLVRPAKAGQVVAVEINL